MQYSVLMTVYKNENPDYFFQSLMSMVSQTLQPDEIVLVKDGGVPQAIQTVIDTILQVSAIRIVQIQLKKNLGLGLALNEGLQHCRNEIVARMDSDDISFPQRCQLQMDEFEKNPKLDIIGSAVEEFERSVDTVVGVRKVPLTNEEIHFYIRRRDPFNHPTVMFRKSKIMGIGGYRDFRKNQDTDLWFRLLESNAIAMNLPQVLLHFRFDEGTYKKRKTWVNTKSLISIRYHALKIKQCNCFDFFIVMTTQLAFFLFPVKFQKFIYRNFLRESKLSYKVQKSISR
jgi:glycosyltransferase involved in cell wall biosynthesis